MTWRAKLGIDWIWLGFIVGLAFLMTGFLIGPRVPAKDQEANCVANINLPGPFGFGLNCDSPELIWLAREPSGLFTKKSRRQSRPGLIFTAAVLQVPLSLVVPFGAPPQIIGWGDAGINKFFKNNLPTYLAYILLNIGILIASFFILRKVTEPEHNGRAIDSGSALLVISTGLLLVANDVTKAFVWSPHMQMFNIFVPVLSLYVTLRLLHGGLFDRSFVLGIGLTVGLGLTAYSVFVVVMACAIPLAIGATINERTRRGRAIAHLAIFLVLSVVPSLLWYAYVRTTTGAYYSAELADGDVVWMAEDWAQGIGHFVHEWFGSLWEQMRYMAPQAIPLAALIIWLAVFALRHRGALRGADQVWPILAAGFYVSLAVLGFYTCVGWGDPRLAYPQIPPLIAAVGAAALILNRKLPAAERRELPAGFLTITLAQVVVVVSKYGPWS